MRGTSFAFLICSSLVAASASAEPKQGKEQASADGSYSIRLTQLSEGACTLEVRKGSQVVWSLERCLGTVDDLFFVSNSGERFWLLRTIPQKPPEKRSKSKKPRPPAWTLTEVAVLYDREGNALERKQLGELLPARLREEVRHLERHFKWMEGVLGVPGKMPRVNDLNQVELETVGTKSVKLPFRD
ncbi:MAG: hypothetical protein HYZ28_11555 [Myxococcales bacterium]|nr:hypothetical protein [Myxococcales bacterium]